MSPLRPAAGMPSSKPPAALQAAGAALARKDYAGAETLLAERLRTHADDHDAAAMLGEVLNRTQRPAEAVALLRPRLDREPAHAAMRRELAFACVRSDDLLAALTTLAPVFLNHTTAPDVQHFLRRSMIGLGLPPERAQPRRWIWQQLGAVFLGLGDRRGAELCDDAACGAAPPGEQYAEFALDADIAAHCRRAGSAVHVLRGVKIEPLPGAYASAMPPLDSFVCALPGGGVLGHSFIPVAADGSAFTERCINNISKHLRSNAAEMLDTVRIGADARILCRVTGSDEYRGHHVLIGNLDNAGHWFYNHFGRLRLLDELPRLADARLVVGDNIRPVQLQSLARAGIAPERILRIPRGRIARFEELWVPSLLFGGTRNVLCWHAGLTHYIRRRLRLEFPVAPRRRLFIGRATARWRHLVNEAEVFAALQALGFESIDPGALSLDEQIAVAAEAQIIVAVFGAGTNLHLFAPENAPLVELKFDAQNQMDIHPYVAEDIGQPHYEVMGEVSERAADILHSDFRVAPEAVLATVRAALAAAI